MRCILKMNESWKWMIQTLTLTADDDDKYSEKKRILNYILIILIVIKEEWVAIYIYYLEERQVGLEAS